MRNSPGRFATGTGLQASSATRQNLRQHLRQAVDLGLGRVEVVADAEQQSVRALDHRDLDAARPQLLAESRGADSGGQLERGHRAVQARRDGVASGRVIDAVRVYSASSAMRVRTASQPSSAWKSIAAGTASHGQMSRVPSNSRKRMRGVEP